MVLSIGVIGNGVIGREVVNSVSNGDVSGATITGIYDRNPNDLRLDVDSGVLQINNTDEIVCDDPFELIERCDIVVECASHSAVKEYAVPFLENGVDFLSLSVGALSDQSLHSSIIEAAKNNGSTFEVPSGALAGVDAIKASTVNSELDEVIFTTIKPPSGLKGATHIENSDIDLDEIEKKVIVFEGTAREAAPAFPANINVSVALSLAGIGLEDTIVKIYADPDETDNVHIIQAKGGAGDMELKFETKPHPDNAKTSYVAALSTIASLKRRTDSVIVGT